MLFRPPSTSGVKIWWVIFSDSSLSSLLLITPFDISSGPPSLLAVSLFLLLPPDLIWFYISSHSHTCLYILLITPSSLLLYFYNPPPFFLFFITSLSSLIYSSMCLHLPLSTSPALVIVTLSVTFNFLFLSSTYSPCPPSTDPVQCLRRGWWPLLCSEALLWRTALLVSSQIQPGQETPHHGMLHNSSDNLLFNHLPSYLLSKAKQIISPCMWSWFEIVQYQAFECGCMSQLGVGV